MLQKLTNVLMFKYRALRNFVSQDIALLVHAFIVYVSSIVEHNSLIWSPQNVEEIERV